MSKRLNECLNDNFEKEYILPFFWQHGEPQETLEKEMDAIRACGIKEFCVESRTHEKFCEDQWWDDFRFMLEYARKHDMKVWLLDDKHFPTGYANGYINDHPELRQVTVTNIYRDINGGNGPINIQAPYINGDESFVLIAAYKRIEKSGEPILLGENPIVLTDKLEDRYITVDLPEGLWRIFYMIKSQQRHNRRDAIDMLNPESTKAMLTAVYEPHYEHFKEYFGNTFKGFFSDEPCFGNANASYYGRLGNMNPIAWRDDMPELIAEKNGMTPEQVLNLLPAFFQDVENVTSSVRATYMDIVSDFYGKNFCYMLGDWCRERGVMYIGHIIEDQGAHLSLCGGPGHYFRALDGQDMAGIDIVLHQVQPGVLENVHEWIVTGDPADPKIFNYLIAKLAASHSHIDEKKKGRAMCEIFGAFGWAEGMPVMKKMADLFLASGINYYVPHAFTPRFNDGDCPPHFYNHGTNTQFKLFGDLMGYMQRVSHILSGGTHKADVAVLYSTGIWTAQPHMPTEEIAKVLTQAHIDFDIIPEDYMLTKCTAENKVFKCNNETYGAIVVPYLKMMPIALRRKLDEFAEAGIPVYFINGEPEMYPELNETFEAKGKATTVKFKDIVSVLRKNGHVHLTLSKQYPHVRCYETVSDDINTIMFLNEDETVPADFTVPCNKEAILYDAYENKIYKPSVRNGKVRIKLEPSCSIILIQGNDLPKATTYEYGDKGEWIDVETEYTVSVCNVGETEYKEIFKTNVLNGVSHTAAPKAEYVRYEFKLPENNKKHTFIDLGYVGETAELWINGECIGTKITKPYSFDISGKLNKSENDITVNIIVNQVYQKRDGLSEFLPIPVPGICGKIKTRSY